MCDRQHSPTLRFLASLFLLASPLFDGVVSVAAGQASGSMLDALRQLQGQGDASGSSVPSESGPATWSVEQPVDPSRYHLLPGDLVAVGVWGETPETWRLRVTPTGSLVVPNAGPVDVGRRTLSEAEVLVARALQPVYPRSRASLTLIEPGRFRITVAGMVGRPGIYEVTGFDRLSMALESAGGIRAGGSVRRVRMRSISPDAFPLADLKGASWVPEDSLFEVDLLPWIVQGELASNPTLRPGLIVDVPLQRETVRIRGPVHGRSGLEVPAIPATRIGDRPEEEPDLVVEWREGDTIGSLLAQIGGVSERATGEGILHRLGERPRTIQLAQQEVQSAPLEPGDLIEVGYAARWVFVNGAVRSPGRFPYLPGFRSGDYIAMAGGATELGRATGWTVRDSTGVVSKVGPVAEVNPGSVLRVPERRSYKVMTILGPLSSATALIISIAALTR